MVRVSGPSLDELDDRGDRIAAEMRRGLMKVMKSVAPRARDVIDLNVIRTQMNRYISEELIKSLQTAWIRSAENTYQQLLKAAQRVNRGGERQSETALTAAIDIPKVSNELGELYLANSVNRLYSVSDLLWDKARAEMLKGMEAGESIEEIQKRLMDVPNLAAPQAEVIARTEVIGASNAGSYAEMKATGLPALKEWIAAADSRTRPSHEHVDETVLDIDEKFIVGGYAMSYPHDPTGPPSEVINCRCTLGWDIPDEAFDDEDDDDMEIVTDVETVTFHLPGKHDQKDHGRKGLRGLKAGKPLKITHGLIHKKHPDGSIVAVTKDGKKHILWEANKYHLREKDEKGLWQTKKTAIKSKAYKEINDFASDWHEPDNEERDDKKSDTDAKPKTDSPEFVSADEEVTAGDKISMSQELIDADMPDNSIFAISGSGKLRLVKKNDKIEVQVRQDGIGHPWEIDTRGPADYALDMISNYKDDWYVPKIAKSDKNEKKADSSPSGPAAKSDDTGQTVGVAENATPGAPLKITHGLVHKKHPDNTTVAINSTGDKKVNWDGKQYELLEKQPNGSWDVKTTAKKSKAYKEINDFDSSWHEPVSASSPSTAAPSSPSAPGAPSAPATPTPSAPSTLTSPTLPDSDIPKPIASGAQITVDDNFVSQDFPNGAVVAVSKDGAKKVVFNDDKFAVRRLNPYDGTWQTVNEGPREYAVGMLKAQFNDWFEPMPDGAPSSPAAPPAAMPTPPPAPILPTTMPNGDPITVSDDGVRVGPGAPLTIDDAFIRQDFPDDSIIAVSSDGTKKIVWNNDEMEIHEWDDYELEWEKIDSEGKEDIGYVLDDYDGEGWSTPIVMADEDDSPPEDALPTAEKPSGKSVDMNEQVSPGKPVVLSQEYLDYDYPNESTVAVSANGDYRLVLRKSMYEVQKKNPFTGSWSTQVSAPREHPQMLAALDGYAKDWTEPAGAGEAPTAPSTPPPPAATPTTPVPKSYTPMQKAYAQSIFGSNGVKWHSDSKKMYDTALEVSKKDPSLTMGDALAIMDQSLTKKTGNPFQTKMVKFLGTKAGKKYAQEQGGSASIGSTVQTLAPNPSANAPVSTNSSSYKSMNFGQATSMQTDMNLAHPPPWTAEQISALRTYTGGAYTPINKCLRGTGTCSPSQLKTIAGIKAGMKPSTKDIKIYRKTNIATFGVSSLAELEKLKGGTFKDKGVISTSIKSGAWSGNVHMIIEAPKGSKMAWVAPISYYKSENEFALAPGTEFEVLDIVPHDEYPGTVRVMRVRVIPGSGD